MNTTNYKLELTAEELKAVHTALQYSKTNPYNPLQTERAIYSASSKIEAAQHPQDKKMQLNEIKIGAKIACEAKIVEIEGDVVYIEFLAHKKFRLAAELVELLDAKIEL